ncbi:MAG: type ISP restriction/modification enzyme, partial [Dolichospermum sp.]
VKAGKAEEAVFKLFSRGVATQRDEWVYDLSKNALEEKVKFLIQVYQGTLEDAKYPEKNQIKWDRELTKYLDRKISKTFEFTQIVKGSYRPFYQEYFYFDKHFNGMTYQWFDILNETHTENKYIAFLALGNTKPFHCLASNLIVDLHFTGDSQCLPLYRYDKEGNRIDN